MKLKATIDRIILILHINENILALFGFMRLAFIILFLVLKLKFKFCYYILKNRLIGSPVYGTQLDNLALTIIGN